MDFFIGGAKMKIWKLSPINIDSAVWIGSYYKGDAIVRAKDEKEAKNIANQKLWSLVGKVSPCQETPHSPWLESSEVECIELNNSKYSKDGPAMLLEPECFDQ